MLVKLSHFIGSGSSFSDMLCGKGLKQCMWGEAAAK